MFSFWKDKERENAMIWERDERKRASLRAARVAILYDDDTYQDTLSERRAQRAREEQDLFREKELASIKLGVCPHCGKALEFEGYDHVVNCIYCPDQDCGWSDGRGF